MIINTKSMKGGVIWLLDGINEDEDDAEKSSLIEDDAYAASVIECSSFQELDSL